MKKTTSPRAAFAQLEALESRLLLSGTVTVSVVANVLKIAGDVSSNQISIAQTGLGAYTIAGLDGTQVKLGANVAASQQVAGATKDISIDMSVGAVGGNAGDDIVELASNLHVGVAPATLQGTRGSITFKGSAGNDQVFLGGTAATGTVTFNANPADADTIQITDAVGNSTTFEFDTGALHNQSDTQVVIGASAADTMTSFLAAVKASDLHLTAQDTSTGGSVSCQLLSIPGTAGNQPVVVTSPSDNITATDLTGGADYLLDALNVTATMGDGKSLFSLGSLSTTPVNFASTIHGNLSITGGKSNDLVVDSNVCVHGTLTASMNTGNNKLVLVSSLDTHGERLNRVDGNMSYTALAGDNDIDMELGEVGGTLKVSLGTAGGNGNDIHADGAIINGAVSYTAGPAGDNTVDFTSALLGSTLGVTTGSGNDTINLNGANIIGNVTVNPGAGTNLLSADQNNGASASILGAFSYTTTSGAFDENTLEFVSATLGSTLSVTAGASSNSVDLSGVNVAGKTTLALGTGSNDVEAATQPIFAGAFSFTATSPAGQTNTLSLASPVFGGGVTVTTGASDDTIDLSGARVIGNTTISVGAGLNTFQVIGTPAAKFLGNFAFTATGSGDDSVTVGDTSGASTVAGGLTIATGSGDDTVDFDANVAGNLSINTGTSGSGDTIDGSGGTVTGTATIKAGNTAGTEVIDLLNVTFMRATAITTGAGTTNADVEGSEFCRRDGAFSLTSGGASNVSVATATSYARPTTFWRGVNVTLGSGGDLLKIGASTVAGGTGDANTHALFLSAASAPAFNAGTGTNHLYDQLENGTLGLTILNTFLLTPLVNAKF